MNEDIKGKWIAPSNAILPDFIICGAMKCGTTSLHAILDQHPDVYIPKSEVHFFDINNIYNHPDFFFYDKGVWQYPNMEVNRDALWEWYSNFFRKAPKNSIIGEDSTNYLASSESAERIAMQKKPIKAVVCLRNPTKRAYSHYWHMLASGRSIYNFEDSIKYLPETVLSKSMYYEQVDRYLNKLPRNQIFFFILEEFLQDKEKVIKELSYFLGIDYDSFPEGAIHAHTNKGVIPTSVNLQILKNRMLRSLGGKHYRKHLSPLLEVDDRAPIAPRLLEKVHSVVNPQSVKAPPKMKEGTKIFLDDYFQRELNGLGSLIGKNVESLWFGS